MKKRSSCVIGQVLIEIETKIMTGELQENQQLPSIRVFAREHSLSNATVQKIYAVLKEKKLIYAIPGKGNYVQSNRKLNLDEMLLLHDCIEQIEKYALSWGMCFDDVVCLIKNQLG